MKQTSTSKLVLASLFAALICVATMLIHVPTPGTNGYVNLGDGFILMGAFLLSPGYAAAAAGIGSMLADVLSGYMIYVPGTLLIKGLSGLIAALIFSHSAKKNSRRIAYAVQLLAAVAAELFMVLGYFLYESICLSYGMGALASVPANLGQGFMGIVVAMVLTPILLHTHGISAMLRRISG